VKTDDGGQHIFGLVDCAAAFVFVSKDFVRRFSLPTWKSKVKTHVRLANGQCVTSSTVCFITFELARHEFHRIFYVFNDLRNADLELFYHGLTRKLL
jgi:predicted aspartyl protease